MYPEPGKPLSSEPELRSWPERSCDASSQKGAGDALVASCGSDLPLPEKMRRGRRYHPVATRRRRYFRLAASGFGVIPLDCLLQTLSATPPRPGRQSGC